MHLASALRRAPSLPATCPALPPTAARPPHSPAGASSLPSGPAPSRAALTFPPPSPLTGSPHSTAPRRLRSSSPPPCFQLPRPPPSPDPSPFLHLSLSSPVLYPPIPVLTFPLLFFNSSRLFPHSRWPFASLAPSTFLYIPALNSKPPCTYPCADRLRPLSLPRPYKTSTNIRLDLASCPS